VRQRGLSDAHFDAVAQSLEESLVELGVGRPLVDEVLAIVGSCRGEVLGRPHP
jgi:hemoglobin